MDVGLVCDACSTFNPMGARGCSNCGEGLTLDPPPPVRASEPTRSRPAADCPTCGSPVPAGLRFCGSCGTQITEETRPAIPPRGDGLDGSALTPASPKKTLFFGAMQQARAKLVLIKGDEADGVSFSLAGQEHIAGRVDAPLLFDEDPYLSPRHANFFYRKNQLLVRDEGSVNGIYIRIRGARTIQLGDRFLIGEQILEAQETLADPDALEATPDGTYYYASPRRAAHFRLIQLLRGGDTGLALRADSNVVTLGREGNDINFPDDPFISGRHAKVEYEGGQLVLTDLGSKNGTFLRVTGDYQLEHGDYVFMGQQLLRVEIV